jgi:2-polyprenyl-3-methyl-5-hydroxy-6-metoxy-1,4-benzoquinol methylase
MTLACPICQLQTFPAGRKLGGYQLYLCRRCDLRFAPEAFDSRLDYTEVYDSPEYVANQVESITSCSDASAFGGMATYRPFFARTSPRRYATLIDLGCGVGRFCHAASLRGWKVIGIDISQKAIEIGRQYARFPMENAGIDDAVSRGERYDMATAFEVLEHLSDPQSFLARMRMLLKTGGQIFCTVPNWNCAEVQEATQADWIPPIHLQFFSKESLTRLAEKAGLCDIAVGKIWTDPLPRSLIGGAKWMRRRILRRQNSPLGLWLHALGTRT